MGIVTCEWPADTAQWNRLNAQCRRSPGASAPTVDGQHDLALLLAAGGTSPLVQDPIFNTERALIADYVAQCGGRPEAAPAVALAGDPDLAWTENASGRPGGCRWLSLAPLESVLSGPLSPATVRFSARSGLRSSTTPILHASCCTGDPGGPPAVALHTSVHVDPFPGDPDPAYVTNPIDWPASLMRGIFGAEQFHSARQSLQLTPQGTQPLEESILFTREALTWSTQTSYRANFNPALFVAAFEGGGRVDLLLEPGRDPGISGTASYLTGDRTRQFVAACRDVVGDGT